MTITYQTSPRNVDWTAMRDVLIADNFDNGRTPEQYRLSFEQSYAVVIAYDETAIVGTARMLSDGVCNAYVVDVWTHSRYRYQGIAGEMMRLLEAQVPGQHVGLFTEHAAAFYERIGYRRSTDGLYEKIVGEWLDNDTRH